MASTGEREGKDPSTTDSSAGQLNSNHLVRRLLMLVVLLAIVAILVVSLPGLGALRHRFGQVDWRLLVVIALLKLCSCLSNIVAFRDVFCRTMSWRSWATHARWCIGRTSTASVAAAAASC